MMEYAAQRSIRICLLSLLIPFALSSAALAQSGSIGNDEKSLSGSREKPRAVESSKPARRAKPDSDERFVISGGRISGDLSSGSVSPNGATRTGGSVQGLSWTSTGRFSARSGSGSFVRSDGCTGRWTASKQ
jgi:hypothetical protein